MQHLKDWKLYYKEWHNTARSVDCLKENCMQVFTLRIVFIRNFPHAAFYWWFLFKDLKICVCVCVWTKEKKSLKSSIVNEGNHFFVLLALLLCSLTCSPVCCISSLWPFIWQRSRQKSQLAPYLPCHFVLFSNASLSLLKPSPLYRH